MGRLGRLGLASIVGLSLLVSPRVSGSEYSYSPNGDFMYIQNSEKKVTIYPEFNTLNLIAMLKKGNSEVKTELGSYWEFMKKNGFKYSFRTGWVRQGVEKLSEGFLEEHEEYIQKLSKFKTRQYDADEVIELLKK